MKKLIIILVLLSTSFLLVTCDNEEDESIEMTTAIIKGSVRADLNWTVAGNENVPQGTKLFARINAKDLVTNSIFGYAYEDILFETTVDANGYYSFTVNAGIPEITVTIFGDEFRYNVITAVDPVTGNVTTQENVLSITTTSTTVTKGSTRIFDLVYF